MNQASLPRPRVLEDTERHTNWRDRREQRLREMMQATADPAVKADLAGLLAEHRRGKLPPEAIEYMAARDRTLGLS